MANEKHKKILNNIQGKEGFQEKVAKVPTLKGKKRTGKSNSTIPDYVANRMARRIAFATGLPTLSGMGVFIGSYILISRDIAEISPSLTLTASALCFFIGLIGLSYGILSASWEPSSGSLIGLENIKPNFERMRAALKSDNITNK